MPTLKNKSNFSLNWRQPFSPLVNRAVASYRAFYYRAKESCGYPKRDIIVYRVEQARDNFEDAQHQFKSALDQFTDLTHFEAGDLESVYRKLKAEFDLSQKKATAVTERIDAIEKVAEALFEEWQHELEQYSNRSLRSHSRQQLKSTRQQYRQLIKIMHRAEAKIQPVLAAFQDQVLLVKHHVNAKAICSLHNEFSLVGVNIVTLISSMEKSISEANAFMSSLVDTPALTQLET